MIQTDPPVAAKIRVASFADVEAIRGVHHRNGLDVFDAAAWRAGWETYPFADEFRDIPPGWVLEAEDGAIVGTIGNIHMLYEMDGRRLRAALATAWAVDVAHRGRALHLTTAFFKQKNLDLLVNGSASPTAARVLTGLQIPRIPAPGYNVPCFWAANRQKFAKAVLQRRNLPAPEILSYPAGFVLMIRDALRPVGWKKPASTLRRLERFDHRFDALCRQIGMLPGRLRAVRSCAVLEWRFRTDLAAGRIAILGALSGSDLTGYAILVRRFGSDLGMSVYDVADMQAQADDAALYKDLLSGAIQLAREDRVDAVKLITGTPAKRGAANALQPYTYQLPFWQLYYKASAALKPALNSADAWDFSLFDTY